MGRRNVAKCVKAIMTLDVTYEAARRFVKQNQDLILEAAVRDGRVQWALLGECAIALYERR